MKTRRRHELTKAEVEASLQGHPKADLIRALLADDVEKTPWNLVLSPDVVPGDVEIVPEVEFGGNSDAVGILSEMTKCPDSLRILNHKVAHPRASTRETAAALGINYNVVHKKFTLFKTFPSLAKFFRARETASLGQRARRDRESAALPPPIRQGTSRPKKHEAGSRSLESRAGIYENCLTI